MKESTADRLHQLLPELFARHDKKVTTGGICSPENGCGPAVPNALTDLTTLLTGLRLTPPAPAAKAFGRPQTSGETETPGSGGEDPPR